MNLSSACSGGKPLERGPDEEGIETGATATKPPLRPLERGPDEEGIETRRPGWKSRSEVVRTRT